MNMFVTVQGEPPDGFENFRCAFRRPTGYMNDQGEPLEVQGQFDFAADSVAHAFEIGQPMLEEKAQAAVAEARSRIIQTQLQAGIGAPMPSPNRQQRRAADSNGLPRITG